VTVIVPCIIERWTWQKYGKLPAVGKFWMNTNPVLCVPEFQMPSGVQTPPGHEPEVVECGEPFHVHRTVSPAGMLIVGGLKTNPGPIDTS